jgi:hypothetical protein
MSDAGYIALMANEHAKTQAMSYSKTCAVCLDCFRV